MVGCVEGILGIRPDLHGLRFSPAIPKEWTEVKIEKDFRGARLHITILNERRRETGCRRLTVNGKELAGNYIPDCELREENEIMLYM